MTTPPSPDEIEYYARFLFVQDGNDEGLWSCRFSKRKNNETIASIGEGLRAEYLNRSKQILEKNPEELINVRERMGQKDG